MGAFKLFFEARQEYIDKIQDAVDKVSDRPFNELFQGKGDRFLIKVYNPNFEKAAKSFDILNKIDIKNRTVDGKNINTFLKGVKQSLKDEQTDINHREDKVLKMVFERMDDVREEIYDMASSLKEKMISLSSIPDKNNKFAYELKTANPPNSLGFLYKTDLTDTPLDITKILNKPLSVTETFDLLKMLMEKKLILPKNRKERNLNNNVFITLSDIYEQYVRYWTDKAIQSLKNKIEKFNSFKQAIDQNNIFYYLLFSRHPIDVLRMSDHKGISSCHRLQGAYSKEEGLYSDCALADARNDGGIVYLIKGSDGRKIQENLNDKDVFRDKDRDTGKIQPIGRIRLRRFIDLTTGKDFAVPAMLQDEQMYGFITEEIYQKILDYTREHQSIYKNPPEYTYAMNNIVLVGGTYSDEDLNDLLDNFFGKEEYANIKHKSRHFTSWQEKIDNIFKTKYNIPNPKFELHAQVVQNNRTGSYIHVRIVTKLAVPYQQQWNETGKFSENLDKVLEDLDHNNGIANLALGKDFKDGAYSLITKTTWTNGILDIDMSFNYHDPDKLLTLTYSLRRANNTYKLITDDLQRYINRKMLAMIEDQKEDQ